VSGFGGAYQACQRRFWGREADFGRFVREMPDSGMSGFYSVGGDAREILNDGWDLLMVAHPPCTRLGNSGVRWLEERNLWLEERNLWADMDEAAALFSAFRNAPVSRIAVENPVMHRHAKAHRELSAARAERATLAIRPRRDEAHLPLAARPAAPHSREDGREPRVHRMPPGPDRWRECSRFFSGIAEAMADQWGGLADERNAA
jgi:hypothetical protein